ncbi:MAG: hypothetical protein IPP22_00560 [Nitrosomonas sp.]|nr:hypothetical protein [Nitrosomonas sp.]
MIPTEVLKLKTCCAGVTEVCAGAVPYSDEASGRILVQFNQAADSPPASAWRKRPSMVSIHFTRSRLVGNASSGVVPFNGNIMFCLKEK